jgi:sporulation protein YlmC with PRC-barrel domain
MAVNVRAAFSPAENRTLPPATAAAEERRREFALSNRIESAARPLSRPGATMAGNTAPPAFHGSAIRSAGATMAIARVDARAAEVRLATATWERRKMEQLIRGGDLAGKHVDGREGARLGSVREIFVDLASGQVRFLIVETASLLGGSGKYRPVPWESVRYDSIAGGFQLPLSKDEFKSAPAYDREQLGSPNSGWTEMTTRHYRSTPPLD